MLCSFRNKMLRLSVRSFLDMMRRIFKDLPEFFNEVKLKLKMKKYGIDLSDCTECDYLKVGEDLSESQIGGDA